MKKLFLVLMLLASVFIIIGCGGSGGDGGSAASVPQSLPDYTSADLTGAYYIFGMSAGTADAGYLYGDLSINSTGYPEGYYFDSNGTGYTIAGDYISIDGNGFLGGAFNTDSGLTSTIQYGKLNAPKNFFSYTSCASNEGVGLFAAIRTGNTYSQSDLTGEWKELLLLVGGDSEGAWNFDSTTIDGEGNMSDPPVQLTLAETGIIEGSGLIGALDYSKEFFIYVGNWSSGEKAFAIVIKKGTGSFTPSDLQGKWYFNAASPTGTSYGYLELDNEGNIKGGHYYSSFRGDGPIMSGSVSLDAEGGITGSFTCSNGLTGDVVGQINISKNMMALAVYDEVESLLIANK